MISPLPDTPLQKAVANVGNDLVSVGKISPIGELIRRLQLASGKKAPDPMDEAMAGVNAVRASQYLTPTAAIGAALGALKGGATQQPPQDILASGLEGGRAGALINPLVLAAGAINAPALRPTPRYPGDESLTLQTLIKNLLTRRKL